MKFEIKVMILSVLISSIVLSSISFMSIEKSFAQSDDSDINNNAIGQKGEGNEASQSVSNSQDSNQNSMCVSGESVSLSCNNLSAKSIDAIVHSNDDEGALPSPDITVNQIVTSLNSENNSAERGWMPDNQKTAFEINLVGLIGLFDPDNPGAPSKIVDFQVHWQDIVVGKYGECKVNQMTVESIDIECEEPPPFESVLTIVATSTDPIIP